MSLFDRLFGKKQPGSLSSILRGGWSTRVRKALAALPAGGPEAVSQLVDLIFKGALTTSVATEDDELIGRLLNYGARMSPASEVASVKAAVQYQSWLHQCAKLVVDARDALNELPGSQLKGNVLDLALAAAGFDLRLTIERDTHSHLPGDVPHTSVGISLDTSDQAVKGLCGIVSPVTSNILHKVASKKDIVVRSGSCTQFSDDLVSFEEQRDIARLELGRRGSPRYDPRAYVAG